MCIRDRVGTDYHGTMCFMELVDNGLKGIRAAVQVVTVQLDGKASAVRMMDTQVPAASDSQIRTFRNKVNDLWQRSIACDDFTGSVIGMVVNDNQVERKISLLFQYGADGILNGPYPVAYGDNDRSLVREGSGCTVCLLLNRRKPGPDVLEVTGKGCFALQLDLPVTRIYVVKLFFSREAGVFFCFGIEVFTDVD